MTGIRREELIITYSCYHDTESILQQPYFQPLSSLAGVQPTNQPPSGISGLLYFSLDAINTERICVITNQYMPLLTLENLSILQSSFFFYRPLFHFLHEKEIP